MERSRAVFATVLNRCMPRDHRKLNAFNLADDLVVLVYNATSDFPAAVRFGLQAQMRRAVVSVPCNIVEGCARTSEGNYLRFLDISFGSCRELLYLCDLSVRLGFVDARKAAGVKTAGDRAAGALVKLRRALRQH